MQSSGFLEEGGQITESLFRVLFLEPRDVALSLIVPGTRLHPRHLMLPCLPPAPTSRKREHANTLHQGAGASKGHIIPASTIMQHTAAPGSSRSQNMAQPCQDTQPKHTVSYPLPPLPWQTWGAHPPWDSRISLCGEEKRQRTCLLHGCHRL